MAKLTVILELSPGEGFPEELQSAEVNSADVEWIFFLANLLQSGNQKEFKRNLQNLQAVFEVRLEE